MPKAGNERIRSSPTSAGSAHDDQVVDRQASRLTGEAVERSLELTGSLAGPEFEGHRRALLDLAEAVDRARNSNGSPTTLSKAAAALLQGLQSVSVPTEEVTLDDFDRLTSDLASGPVRDS